MRLTIPTEFRPLGRLEFALEDTAWVDRHLFAVVDGTSIQRLIILQFEGFLDGVDGAYSFAVPPAEQVAGSNYRFSPSPVRLGASDWVHNTWAFDHRASAEENPGRESDRTLELLAELGLRLEAELIMSRFVRAVGEDARRELILFYIEPLTASGHRLDEFPDGGPPSAVYDQLSTAVTERSLEIFRTLQD